MSEETVKVASLVEKLAGWVEVQPEYPYLFLADRARRKRAARIVANRLLLIPTVKPDPRGVDRETIRRQQRAVSHAVGDFRGKLSKRQQRMEANAVKQRRRYRALSIERAHELALLMDAQLEEQAALIAAMEAELEAAHAAQDAYEGEEFQYADEGEQDGADSQAQDELDGAEDA